MRERLASVCRRRRKAINTATFDTLPAGDPQRQSRSAGVRHREILITDPLRAEHNEGRVHGLRRRTRSFQRAPFGFFHQLTLKRTMWKRAECFKKSAPCARQKRNNSLLHYIQSGRAARIKNARDICLLNLYEIYWMLKANSADFGKSANLAKGRAHGIEVKNALRARMGCRHTQYARIQ